jgi:hypothetical protein
MRRHILRSVPIVISRLRPPSDGDLPQLVFDPPVIFTASEEEMS